MNIINLPTSRTVGYAALEDEIARLLGVAVGGKFFTHSAPIQSAPISGRIFSTIEYPDMVPFRMPVAPDQVAYELHLLTKEARYGLREDPGTHRGWEIRCCILGEKPAAIAWTAWC